MIVHGNAPCVLAVGARSSGKTAWENQKLTEANPDRLLIWDTVGEWGTWGQVFTDRLALMEAIYRQKKFRVVYNPGDQVSKYPARFDWFCRLAYKVGKLTALVAE